MRRYIGMMTAAMLCFSGGTMAKEADWLKMVGTQTFSATLSLNKQAVRGRVSLDLKAAQTDFDAGRISVGAFNVLIYGVSQTSLTGVKPRGQDQAVLGFAVDQSGGDQYLRYDPYKNVLQGELNGRIGFPQLSEFVDYSQQKDAHDFDAPTQSAVLSVLIGLNQPLDLKAAQDKVLRVDGKMELSLDAAESDLPRITAYEIAVPPAAISIDYSIAWLFESARSLCLQPVRMYSFTTWPYFLFNYTGDGLGFGMPGAHNEWKKADIIFSVRDWVTVYGPSFFTFSSSEAAAMRALHDNADCVEIFFADKFSPQALWGGGATFNGGLSSAQIISSDENADFGIDFTHLAHELGHALTLKHPGEGFPNASAPHRFDGTSGTLMCPSGFANDNPQINSAENKTNANNPLLTFSLKVRSAGPDCTNGADCGPCP